MELTQDAYGFTSFQLGDYPLHSDPEHQSDDDTDKTDSSDSFSETTHDEQSDSSDCESCVSSPFRDQPQSFDDDGLIELSEGNKIHDLIKRRLLSCLGSLGGHCKVLSTHRNLFRSPSGRAKFQSFQIFAKAVEKKHGRNANVKFAWYGATRNEIKEILEHGFTELKNKGLYGHGVYLSPDNSPMESVRNSATHVDGLRHLLLCRVILGKSELVHLGSDQSCPSSPDFDSGVDSITSPKKYIIWSTHMNTHILPEFVVGFEAPANLREFVRVPDCLKRPTSPWIPFPALISAISKHLPPSSMRLVLKHYKDQRERKISRFELIQQLRRIAGDRLLVEIVKSFRDKVHKPSR